MNCVIIAAGHGSRLREVGPSKPLVEVAGKPLIEHVIARAIAGGASAFTVVTGHRAGEVEAVLAHLARKLGVEIAPVRVADWDRPNGHSVLAGADVLPPEPHALLMADHLFDPAILALAIAAHGAGEGLTLAVDRRLDSPLVDMDDVTRVETRDGAIVAIGKGLKRYDAFDTGVFVAGPALREALRIEIAAGRESLSHGVAALVGRGLARTVDIGELWWLDVDDPKAHVQAEAALSLKLTPLSSRP